MEKMTPVTEQFVLHWGEMAAQWGINRTVAQIHALLFISGKAMNADEIVETLGVARSNVSNSIKELQSRRLVHTVHTLGDRRDYFAASEDVWALFKVIVAERQRREIEPTLHFLADLSSRPDFAKENKTVRRKIEEMHSFTGEITQWTQDMLKLPEPVLAKILKLGGKIQKLLR